MTNLKSYIHSIGFIFITIFLLLLSGCSTLSGHHRYPSGRDHAPDFHIDLSKIHDAVPKVEPKSKYGNPSSYSVNGHHYYVLQSSHGYDQTGIASWYGMKFYKQRTSSGEPYDVTAMTAASKVLPLPTYARVTNLQNRRSIIVKVNDRGPFHENRIIDLSYVAAQKIGMLPKGTALVEVKAIDPREPETMLSTVESTQTPEACLPSPTKHTPRIYLQLGAFRIENNAHKLAERIKQHTQYPVLMRTSEKNNLPIYRVQIGPIPDVDNTDYLHDALEKAGLGEPITVIQ